MYTVTEPHPTVAPNAYTYAGRGGAGNTFRLAVSTPAAGVPTLATVRSASSAHSASSAASATRYYAGRGGAGNARPVSQRRELSLDAEYDFAQAVASTTVTGHVGRGGAGNFFRTKAVSAPREAKKDRKNSDASSSSSASDGEQPRRSGFWARFRS